MGRGRNIAAPAGRAAHEDRAAVFELLDRLSPREAALLRGHMQALATEAVRQGMLLASSLMMAARDVPIDFDAVARSLPAMHLFLPEAPRDALALAGKGRSED
jgi:hypothetical protein